MLLVGVLSVRTITRNADWKDEITLFSRTVAAADDASRAHLNLGNAYYDRGDYRSAIAEYEKVPQGDPSYAGALSGIAGCHVALGQLTTAADYLRRAIALEPSNFEYYNSLGTVYARNQQAPLAIDAFSRSLELRADNPMAQFNLALLYYMEEDFTESTRLFENLRYKDTEYVTAYYFLAVMAYDAGDRVAGRTHATRFLALYGRDDERTRHLRSLMSQ